MKSKAQVLIDQLTAAAESYDMLTSTETMFSLNDVVKLNENDTELIGIIEDEKDDIYQVRVYAIAGNEYEPTDKVLFRTAEELEKQDLSKHFAPKMQVKWNSQAGVTNGIIKEINNNVATIEVYSGKDLFEQTNISVDLDVKYLSKTSFDIKKKNKKLLCKMDDVSIEIDEKENIGVIEGFGSTYGNVDLGGDTVEKGAYTQTLKHKNGKVKLFFDHGWKTADIAGIAFLEDSEKGLKVRGEMPLDATDVKNAFVKIKFLLDRGEKTGLSIGYDTIKSKYNNDGTRSLQEIALHEMTITPFPMDTEANILEARAKQIAFKSMQSKWATISDAPIGNQDEEGEDFSLLNRELKSIISKFK